MSDREATLYIANPDVSCREEEPDEGAILFNPDTDAVLVINPTGLVLWRALKDAHTQGDLVAYLMDHCEGVPTDEVDADVIAFLQMLQPGGFVGEVLESE